MFPTTRVRGEGGTKGGTLGGRRPSQGGQKTCGDKKVKARGKRGIIVLVRGGAGLDSVLDNREGGGTKAARSIVSKRRKKTKRKEKQERDHKGTSFQTGHVIATGRGNSAY